MTRDVSCINPGCPTPAPRTTITLETVAPGIVADVGRLLCEGCGGELWTHVPDAAPKPQVMKIAARIAEEDAELLRRLDG